MNIKLRYISPIDINRANLYKENIKYYDLIKAQLCYFK